MYEVEKMNLNLKILFLFRELTSRAYKIQNLLRVNIKRDASSRNRYDEFNVYAPDINSRYSIEVDERINIVARDIV